MPATFHDTSSIVAGERSAATSKIGQCYVEGGATWALSGFAGIETIKGLGVPERAIWVKSGGSWTMSQDSGVNIGTSNAGIYYGGQIRVNATGAFISAGGVSMGGEIGVPTILSSPDMDTTGQITLDGTLQIDGDSPEFYALAVGADHAAILNVSAGATFHIPGTSVQISSGALTVGSNLTLPTGFTIVSDEGAVLAIFTHSPGSGHTVDFTDTSFSDMTRGAVNAWSWDFGDSSSSTLQNPTHTYASAGTYTVALTVTTVGGATSTGGVPVVVS